MYHQAITGTAFGLPNEKPDENFSGSFSDDVGLRRRVSRPGYNQSG